MPKGKPFINKLKLIKTERKTKNENFNCEKVAVIIWTCSENADLDEITKEVNEIYRDIRKRQIEDDIEREEEKRIETLIYGYEEMTM